MPRKRQHKPRGTIDTEVVNEIDKQHSRREEIENRRKKRIVVFWAFVFSGVAVIAAGASVLYFFILDW